MFWGVGGPTLEVIQVLGHYGARISCISSPYHSLSGTLQPSGWQSGINAPKERTSNFTPLHFRTQSLPGLPLAKATVP